MPKAKLTNPTRKQILADFLDVLNSLGLTNYTVQLAEEKEDKGAFAVEVDYPYRLIKFYLSDWAIKKKKQKSPTYKEDLIHEAMHVLLWRLSMLKGKERRDEEENVCDHLANLLSGGIKK